MPVVTVAWWAGRTTAQKSEVAKGITEVLNAVGIPPAAVHVVFQDVAKEDWYVGAVPASELSPRT